MDFEQFFKAVLIISQKIYKDLDIQSSLDLLFNTKLAILEESIVLNDKGDSNLQIEQLMEVLKDEFMVEILSCVHKTLIPYYHFYSH